MTTTELKTKIAESPQVDWFNAKEVTLNYRAVNFGTTIKGVASVFEFLERQINGFASMGQNLPGEIKTVKDIYTSTKHNIINIVNTNAANDNTWSTQVKNTLERDNPPKFIYDSPVTDFLVEIFNARPEYYPGAYEFITQPSLSNINAKDRLAGSLLAYEFSMKGDSEISKRKEAEKKSIAKLRSDFEKHFNDSESHLVSYLSTANQKVIDSSNQIDSFLKDKEDGYNTWFQKTSQDFKSFHTASTEKIKALENLYQEKLKLEAPAKYWNDRAKKLRKEGYWWLIGLIVCIGIGVVVLIWILNMIAEGTLTKIFASTATAIKWSVALITLISFIAYAIRIISKLTFSSFHLVRDAEEREQLTYIYLALQREKGIDQTERHLIMQSLFSRADTGLLKDEGAPTMPGNIMDKFTIK